MSDITNNSPVVTEQKLTEFYNDIKPFLGCPAYVTQEGNAEYYSTDEKVVGRWIDGKPLYQKVVKCGQQSASATTVIVPHNIKNVDFIRIVGAWATESGPDFISGNTEIIPNINASNDFMGRLFASATDIGIKQQGGWAGYHVLVIVQYTKTTDSAATTIEQKPTHYSTDEQVVGTWVDGRPIYQKTLFVKTPNSSTTSQELATVGNNIDITISVEGTLGDGVSINCSSFANSPYWTWIYVEGGKLLGRASGWINLNARVTVQYLKTTD